MVTKTIIWRRKDIPGHESALVSEDEVAARLRGTAVFLFEDVPCRMDYSIECTSDWVTRYAVVDGWIENDFYHYEISTDEDGRWWMNGEPVLGLDGCVDIDLNFSPTTNLLPVRRLGLKVGQQAKIRAAWLRFPGFTLEPLEQTYTRTDASTYHFQNGDFEVDLHVDNTGLVLYYADIWVAEAISH